MKTAILSIGLILMLSGCSSSTDLDQPKHLMPTPEQTLVPIDLSHTELPLVAMVSHSDNYKMDIHWNETFGRLELSDELGLNLFIKEDTLSVATKKKEIEGSIFTIDYHIDTDSLISYATSLPDANAKYNHLYGAFEIGGQAYTFENNPLVECSEADIKHMTHIISNMRSSMPHKR